MSEIIGKKTLKAGLVYTLANFFRGALIFITTPIFVRMMNKSDFGYFQNYLSVLSIAEIFVTLNLNASLISARYDYKGKFDRFIFSILVLSSIVSLIWLALVLSFSAEVEEWINVDCCYIEWMIGYLIFNIVINSYQTRERYYYRYKNTALLSIGIALFSTILSLALLEYMDNKILARVIGHALPTGILGIIIYGFFWFRGKQIVFEYWCYAVPICLPYIPHLLSMTVLSSMDKVMITNFCGVEYTAMYGLASTCGHICNVFFLSMNMAYGPWLSDHLIQDDFKTIRKYSYIFISIGFVLIFGAMLVAPEILYVFGGKDYMEAVYVLLPVLMGSACQFLYMLFVSIEQIRKKTAGMAIASVSAALLNCLLNYYFIPRFGYLSAAYTTFVGYLWLLLMHMYLVKKIRCDDAYDYYFISKIIVGMIFLSVGINYIYAYPYVRGIVILLYVIGFAFVMKNNQSKISGNFFGGITN